MEEFVSQVPDSAPPKVREAARRVDQYIQDEQNSDSAGPTLKQVQATMAELEKYLEGVCKDATVKP